MALSLKQVFFRSFAAKLTQHQCRHLGTAKPQGKLPKKLPIAGVKKIVLVSSAKGGVGKSLVSVNLAYAIKHVHQNLQIGILDADLFGPSLPKMTGLSGQPELNKQNMMLPLVNYGVKCMSMGFLVEEENPVIWRGLMVMSALQKLLRSVNWGELDILVVDMPPGTGDTQLSIVQNIPIDGVLLVTTPQQVAQADVVRGANMYRNLEVPILGLVQNMSYYKCSNCSHNHHLFGPDSGSKLAQKLDAELVADIPILPELSTCSDDGCPIVVKDPQSDGSQVFLRLGSKVVEKLKM